MAEREGKERENVFSLVWFLTWFLMITSIMGGRERERGREAERERERERGRERERAREVPQGFLTCKTNTKSVTSDYICMDLGSVA